MIIRFQCVNLSSKNPERLVRFYNEKLGIPIQEMDKNFDGVRLGFLKDAPVITIWNESRWGKSSEGSVNLVFSCDDLDKSYRELSDKGITLNPPVAAIWGGKELPLLDPDGNKILLL